MITLNTAKDIYCKNNRNIHTLIDDERGDFKIYDEGCNNIPEEIALSKETSKEIMEAIYELSYYHRIPIILFYYNNMSLEEISFIL